METDEIAIIVDRIAEAARNGVLLSQERHDSTLDRAPAAWCRSSPTIVASAIRRLGPYCDWTRFRRASRLVEDGVPPERLHSELRRIDDKSEEIARDPEYRSALAMVVEISSKMRDDRTQFHEEKRKVEVLMGYDEAATSKVVDAIGPWDDTAVFRSFVDLIPEEVAFPLRMPDRSMAYDHRIHSLIRELLSRIGEEGRRSDEVIKDCGSVIGELFHRGDEQAFVSCLHRQLVLLADEYVRRDRWDVMGLCWRGELACWVGDHDLAEEHADGVWTLSGSTEPDAICKLTSFFAIMTELELEWDGRGWAPLDRYRRHLGGIEQTWIDRREPLATAIVRRASRRGVWDTPLLCSTVELEDNFYFLGPDALPTECWVWLAEHSDRMVNGDDYHFRFWINAFHASGDDTPPRLKHNIIVVLLVGLLLDKLAGYDPPPIQRLLETLHDLHRGGSHPNEERAALETLKYVHEEIDPDHLTAADRLAITRSIEGLERRSGGRPISDASQTQAPEPPVDRIGAAARMAEPRLRGSIGEATWARLSPDSRREFYHGEFHYIVASEYEGEKGDFNSFVMCYSRGLLGEIQDSLRGALLREPSLKAEFLAAFGQDESPEWPELLLFLRNIDGIAGTTLGKRLLGQRVALHRLPELREPFETMKSCRNRAAHTKQRIDREEAALLHDLLFNQGLIRKVVEFFPKAPRR